MTRRELFTLIYLCLAILIGLELMGVVGYAATDAGVPAAYWPMLEWPAGGLAAAAVLDMALPTGHHRAGRVHFGARNE